MSAVGYKRTWTAALKRVRFRAYSGLSWRSRLTSDFYNNPSTSYLTKMVCSPNPPTKPGNHRSDGSWTGQAQTFKPDHSKGADH